MIEIILIFVILFIDFNISIWSIIIDYRCVWSNLLYRKLTDEYHWILVLSRTEYNIYVNEVLDKLKKRKKNDN